VNDIITSIDNIIGGSNNAEVDAIYNMQGQKLNAIPQQGVVIVNGKKKVVK
jgi:hypothetical protein